MTREELAGLPVDELIDLILQQQTLIEQLQTQVAELEAQLQALADQLAKNSRNSGKPLLSHRRGGADLLPGAQLHFDRSQAGPAGTRPKVCDWHWSARPLCLLSYALNLPQQAE